MVTKPSERLGDPHSYVGYGPMWAQVSMTPFSQYKGNMAEGGIRNALIVSGPIVKRSPGSVNRGVLHVADLMPTLLEVAGRVIPRPSTVSRRRADRQVLVKTWQARRFAPFRRGLPSVGNIRQSRGPAR